MSKPLTVAVFICYYLNVFSEIYSDLVGAT